MTRHDTSWHVMSRHVLSCPVMSRHVTSCHVMSCHVMSRHVMSRYVTAGHVTAGPVTSCHVMSRHARHVTSWYVMCNIMSRHARHARHVTSRHVMSCHVMLPRFLKVVELLSYISSYIIFVLYYYVRLRWSNKVITLINYCELTPNHKDVMHCDVEDAICWLHDPFNRVVKLNWLFMWHMPADAIVFVAKHSARRPPTINLHAASLVPMYYSGRVKVRVSPVQWSKPYSINSSPLSNWSQAGGFKIISGDQYTTTAQGYS